MKEKIITRLTEIVSNYGESAIRDFEKYDKPSLDKNENTPFFWSVYKYGTHLEYIDIKLFTEWIHEYESFRFSFLQNNIDSFVGTTTYCASRSGEQYDIWYYNGEDLIKVDLEKRTSNEATPITIANVALPIYWYLLDIIGDKYPDAVRDFNKHIPINFENGAFKKVLEIAHTENGHKLIKELRTFRNWVRRASDQSITIYPINYEKDSFEFYEKVNGDTGIVGGIIWSKYSNTWSKHT